MVLSRSLDKLSSERAWPNYVLYMYTMIPTPKPLNLNPLSSKLHPEKKISSGLHMIHTYNEGGLL